MATKNSKRGSGGNRETPPQATPSAAVGKRQRQARTPSPEIRKKLIPLFHYSLNPGGLLFLGSAETIGSFSGMFSPLISEMRVDGGAFDGTYRIQEYPGDLSIFLERDSTGTTSIGKSEVERA